MLFKNNMSYLLMKACKAKTVDSEHRSHCTGFNGVCSQLGRLHERRKVIKQQLGLENEWQTQVKLKDELMELQAACKKLKEYPRQLWTA